MQYSIKINPCYTSKTILNNNTSFKAKTSQQREIEHKNYLEKKAFINEKTKTLDDICSLSFIVALFSDVHHINFKDKLSSTQKLGLCAFAVTCISLIAKLIKEAKLSKQYDEEMKK